MPGEDDSNHITIVDHYAGADEAGRLYHGTGQLEFVRTLEIIGRYAPPPPAVVLDVGGGTGIYALPLAQKGYEVHLIDPVPKHCAQARQASDSATNPLAGVNLGDARALECPDGSVDCVLLLGPLYHLIDQADRLQALREAARVLRPGGVVFTAAISRFASAMDGIFSGYLMDPEFRRIVAQDLWSGQHRNPTGHPGYFTMAYFHHPTELAEEMTAVGLAHECTLAVEGIACLLSDFDTRWADEVYRKHLLDVLRHLEAEPSMLGASSHLLAVGKK